MHSLEPFATGWLDTGEGHELYWERVGTPGAQPAVAIHGGPGSGASEAMRSLFEPSRFDVLLFDQRGCGRSRPFGSLANNTTRQLVADIERLRTGVMRIDKWLVVGGSWGSFLGLSYAQAHPAQVQGLVLRGMFTGTRAEMDWFYRDGLRQVFPDKWDAFVAPLRQSDRSDVLAAYDRLLRDRDRRIVEAAAAAWCTFEEEVSVLEPQPAAARVVDRDVVYARTQVHYFTNQCFVEDGALLANVDRVRGIPAVIVHGRLDMTCPLEYAWRLHEQWPEAQLRIVEMAGHSITSGRMLDVYKAAIAEFAVGA